jgi:hypothetical protein
MRLDVVIQIPSSTPFVNVSFVYSTIDIDGSLNSQIDVLNIYTSAGGISSKSQSLLANTASITTSAGAITGHYSIGEDLLLKTDAGTIDIDVDVNTSIKSPKANFETLTTAGLTKVALAKPLKHRNQISSKHTSQAGAVEVTYPLDWEGLIEASTMVGGLTLSGDGIVILESKGSFLSQYQKAKKGDDYEKKSYVNLQTGAGSLSFTVQ